MTKTDAQNLGRTSADLAIDESAIDSYYENITDTAELADRNHHLGLAPFHLVIIGFRHDVDFPSG